ncbi:DUF6950 family protein [Caulobacter sp.]|uniref:DUF6950 family protein n=1 Tax=Caulobacter sp. TaxID=78 RepID=UPI003BAF9A3B
MKESLVRIAAARAASEKFLGQPLDWGKTDCVRILAFTMRQMRSPLSLAKAGSYSTPTGALKALKRTGFATLEEALDDRGLPRITPARALPADVLAMPGEDGLAALWIVMGNGRALGYHCDSPKCSNIAVNLDVAVGAWSTYRG